MSIFALIAAYGYWGVFLGAILEGEMFLVLGGLAAHAGYLSLELVLISAFLGALASDFFFFVLGRYRGDKILKKWPWLHERMQEPQHLIHKHALWITFVMRFMYGFRNLVPFSLGMTPIKSKTFIMINTVGAMLWVTVVGFGGYYFGELLRVAIGRFRHYELKVIFWTIIIAAIIHFGYRLFKWIVEKILY